MKKLIILVFIKKIFISYCYSQTFRNSFDTYESGPGGAFGQGYSYHSNVSAELNWGEALYPDAYLTMFKATKDKRYLEKFIIHNKRVLEKINNQIKI